MMSDKLKKMPDLTLNKAMELVRQRGASVCANLSEVAYKSQLHRDKQKHSKSHANKAQDTGVKVKQYQNVNKCHKCTRYG